MTNKEIKTYKYCHLRELSEVKYLSKQNFLEFCNYANNFYNDYIYHCYYVDDLEIILDHLQENEIGNYFNKFESETEKAIEVLKCKNYINELIKKMVKNEIQFVIVD